MTGKRARAPSAAAPPPPPAARSPAPAPTPAPRDAADLPGTGGGGGAEVAGVGAGAGAGEEHGSGRDSSRTTRASPAAAAVAAASAATPPSAGGGAHGRARMRGGGGAAGDDVAEAAAAEEPPQPPPLAASVRASTAAAAPAALAPIIDWLSPSLAPCLRGRPGGDWRVMAGTADGGVVVLCPAVGPLEAAAAGAAAGEGGGRGPHTTTLPRRALIFVAHTPLMPPLSGAPSASAQQQPGEGGAPGGESPLSSSAPPCIDEAFRFLRAAIRYFPAPLSSAYPDPRAAEVAAAAIAAGRLRPGVVGWSGGVPDGGDSAPLACLAVRVLLQQ